MVNIERNGTKVNVKLDAGYLNTIYFFSYDCGNEQYAKLLNRHINKLFDDNVESIRREAYEIGYKHGKQHTAKLTWFSRLFKLGTF